MRVLVTRPAAQAATWVDDLRAAGLDAVALPLIAIAGPDRPADVAAAWRTLAERRLVVFVSPNAAQQFFDHAPPDAIWPDGVLAAAPGPGTSAWLRQRGLAAGRIVEPAGDAVQFDSEALWAQLQGRDWRGASVLVVRGASGRDWLTQRLQAAGARVELLAAYRRALPVLDASQRGQLERALAEPADHAWLLSSSESVDALVALATPPEGAGAEAEPVASEAPFARLQAACAVATHPRIAARAQQRGFGSVHACRPTRDAVVACIQSLRP